MKIAVVMPMINQKEVSQQAFSSFKDNQTTDSIQYCVVDNGSTEFVRDWLLGLSGNDLVIKNVENVGVVKAYNQAWIVLRDLNDYIFYTHNDVLIFEKGWDEKLIRILEHENNRIDIPGIKKVGVAGFYGAKGIGTPDIYRAPYRMQQMIRIENVSNCNRMDKVHGYRSIRHGEVEDVAVMDGFSLIVNVDLLNQINGFDRTYPPHHMYDNDMCIESLDKGFRNIVIGMDAQHLGGRTDVNEAWEKPFGKTKQQIHEEAHPVFYKKWAPDNVKNGKHKICLPVRV